MSKQPIITAIDIGTDKCATLIAAVIPETNQLEVIGISVVPSKGIKKSAIIDLEAVLSTLSEGIESAERMAGVHVKSAYVSLSGSHIRSQNSRGVVAVSSPNQEITRDDVTKVIEAAQAVTLPNERTILHVIPRDFRVDSQGGIKDPVGMTGIRLESEAHIISSLSTAVRNVEKCIHDVGLDVSGFVFSGLASSEVVVSETEKELGVAVIDIGAGSTTISAFVEGALEYSTALPVGARHITQDIALGCRISIEAAEKIKIALSKEEHKVPQPIPGESKDDLTRRRKKADTLEPSVLGVTEHIGTLSKKAIVEGIMVPRMKEIFSLVGEQLQKQELFGLIPAGVILTGGGAETVEIAEVAKKTLRLPAHIGVPPRLPGLTSDVARPAFATSIGLLEYGLRQGGATETSTSIELGSLIQNLPISSITKKIGSVVKSLLP